ncbi:MFS general substrate transporter [Trichophyton interdigitale]|uniref:MFS general substrate transporter n=1 Tax=Trichophyton interdigitale TaxID=101480 RepID=A0A9P4YM94_9EURO|nr:MFS general substrate transporter [Trichophyton interdigitale]KAF3900050.1 MFS general substrate transporter [Trichophyton interdigitale]KAG8211141.1 MFS general substrate transporter [Trichophyton interdigitale]
MGPNSREPWLFKLRSSEAFIIFVITVAMFTIIPVIPKALVSRAGVAQEDVQFWVSILLAAYGATLLLGSPLFGYLSDHFRSRKLPFTLGLVSLCSSTILFAFARTPAVLVVARAFQGLSCAAVWVVGLVLLVDNIPQERIGQAMGYTTVGMTMGGLLGPMLGGVSYDLLGYYGVFIFPTLLIILDIILRFALIEQPVIKQSLEHESSGEENTEQNARGISADANPNPSNQRETDEELPLLSTQLHGANDSPNSSVLLLMRSLRLLVALLSAAMLCLVLSSLETTVPLFVMGKFHWTPSGAGLIFLPVSLTEMVSGSIMGSLVDRFGARRPGSLAFVVTGVAFFSLRFILHNTILEKILMGGLLAIVGLGITTVQIIAMTEVSQVVFDYEAQSPGIFGGKPPMAQAYALFNMAYASGQMLGPVVAGSLQIRTGWSGMTLFFGISSALCALPMGLWSGTSSKVEEGDENNGPDHQA